VQSIWPHKTCTGTDRYFPTHTYHILEFSRITMAPSIVRGSLDKTTITTNGARHPLKGSGSLDCFESFEVTTVIGTEFLPGVQLSQFLSAPNSDDLIRDLALLSILSLSITLMRSLAKRSSILPLSRNYDQRTGTIGHTTR
jgi:hypothetical protein